MKWQLKGTTMQFLSTEIEPGEVITSESGKMMYMSDNINMDTKAKGGVGSSLKRTLAGQSFFLVDYEAKGGSGLITFASKFPGKIIPLDLDEDETIIAQKEAFLCSKEGTLDMSFTKNIGAGFLGGEGIVLVRLDGPGQTFLNVGGEIEKIDLKEDEKLRIDTGCLAAFDDHMEYSVDRIKGVKNIFFGGKGLFVATIEGPGRVWIQSMPIEELAGVIGKHIGGSDSGNSSSSASEAAGSAIGSLLKK